LSDNNFDELSAIEKIDKALYLMREVSNYDSTQKPLCDGLENISIQLSEFCRDLKQYSEHLTYDSKELNDIQDRLNVIYDVKRRYGGSVAETLKYYETIQNKLDFILNSDKKIEQLTMQKKKYVSEILSYCKNISEIRLDASKLITKQIEPLLHELGMTNAKFDIIIERKKVFNVSGYDKIEFIISTNVGESLKPLSKIASGGEMSRIMLALKTVLANYDNIDTFIFDEIDTGVSGRTAVQVAQKLALISQNHQILCITHLPQIGAMSDKHFLIEKSSTTESTTTNIYDLDYNDSVKELARLIGGAIITQSTMTTADEMKQQAIDIKNVICKHPI
jgi:DNA repair protein RecN (Recombination protein N)